jgi:RNA methyltransferase, TrmH family
LITSPHNEKLKLVRALHQRRGRAREGLFVTEGEDLLEAGLAAGAEPTLLLTLAGSGLGGIEVEAGALASASGLGSGTRAIAVWRQPWGPGTPVAGPVCLYLHAVSDPGNVGAVIRTAHALVEGSVVLGPGCADPYSPKAVRATMGAIFRRPVVRASAESTPAPRVALSAHGGRPIGRLEPPLTLCLGAEREGLPADVLGICQDEVTIPLRAGDAESLNVAAAAAIALDRVSSAASGERPEAARVSDGATARLPEAADG